VYFLGGDFQSVRNVMTKYYIYADSFVLNNVRSRDMEQMILSYGEEIGQINEVPLPVDNSIDTLVEMGVIET